MSDICKVEVSEEGFIPGKVLDVFTANLANRAGGIVSFSGHVRAEAGRVSGLFLQHYPGFTEKQISTIAKSALERWDICGLHIIHRVGLLLPGEAIVFVGVGAAHRRAAFEAADFLMDYLKTHAPFWKKQTGAAGEEWIDPKPTDYDDIKRWAYSDLLKGDAEG